MREKEGNLASSIEDSHRGEMNVWGIDLAPAFHEELRHLSAHKRNA